jgi:hypothetical protein
VRALALAVVVVAMLVIVLGLGLAFVAAMLVSAVRHHQIWHEPGLPMHELIAPTGELQDPQYLDRRHRPADETAARRRESVAGMPLMSRAPWTVQKSARSVKHG